jgi:DNA repair protein RadA/Sms
MICQNCGYDKIPKDKLQCPKCKTMQTGPSTELRRDWSVLLKDVKSSDVDRIKTGPWDVVFGTNFQTGESGMARSSVNLIAGAPGAGKSTLFLQIADIVAEQGEVLYIAAEEPDDQIKARADRLGVKNQGKIRMVSVMKGDANVAEIVSAYRPILLILDSVSAMAGDNLQAGVGICKTIKQFCASNRLPGLLSSHVTKQGDIGGLEALQHEVDSTITFFPEEGEGEDVPRVLHVEKNRNGRAFISYPLLMTEKGLVPLGEGED